MQNSRKMMWKAGGWLLGGCFWLAACPALGQVNSGTGAEKDGFALIERFERDVRPMLLENCVGCHSKAVGKVMGGLSMDSRQDILSGGDSGPAILLDDPGNSLFLEAVRRESFEMPPEKPLDRQQIAVLEQWILDGAVWPESNPESSDSQNWVADRARAHWAWQPIAPPTVPNPEGLPVSDSHRNQDGPNLHWARGPIDAFVYMELRKRELYPTQSAPVDDLLRRLTFDLTGLPPSLEQQQQFHSAFSQDQNEATVQMVDQLLASPQFGVQWGRHWLDLMRYAETLGHEFDYPIRHAWHYRDAVVDAMNDDLDYRRFVSDHLAGDLVEQPRYHPLTGVNQSLALTGWWWLGDSVHAPVDVKQDLATRTENQIDVLSKSFLGMTVACARCHDHKFDAISMQDYYGLVGIANSTRRRYAITDPHDRIAKHLKLIQQKSHHATQSVLADWSQLNEPFIERWLEAAVKTWSSLPAAELDQYLPASSPLYPLRLLIDSPLPLESSENGTESEQLTKETAFSSRHREMHSAMMKDSDEYRRWVNESPLMANFDQHLSNVNGLPSGWTLEAIDSQVRAEEQARWDWFTSHWPLPRKNAAFHSALFGRKQFQTLRSPAFSITHPFVCLKMRGKSTQSSIVVSNYFMSEFHGLLFSDLRKPIDQPEEDGWVLHSGDLRKYLGYPAFISLENEAGAWFELSEVRFSDRAPPVEPHRWALELLDLDSADIESFKNHLRTRLRGALDDCFLERNSDVAVQVVRWMIKTEPISLLGKSLADRLTDWANQMQMLDDQTPQPVLLLAAEEGTPSDASLELRGNPHRTGETVSRDCFAWLPIWQPVEPHSSGRSELAKSLCNQDHPLVARVIVNRVWHHLMGEGLVLSTDNFGVLGSRPSHPELLDWLAVQFMEHEWSIKWLIRQIVTSRTYALGSTPESILKNQDPEGRWLSYRPVRRLTAENLRDAILFTCGQMDNLLGGPSVPVFLTDHMTGRGRPGQSGPLDGQNRRSIYLEVRRNFLNPSLLVFDYPMPSTTAGRRHRSNLPSQALCLLNDPLVAEMSLRWAQTTALLTEPKKRIERMFQTAFSRTPTNAEMEDCLRMIEQSPDDSWTELAHVFLNAKAFYYLR